MFLTCDTAMHFAAYPAQGHPPDGLLPMVRRSGLLYKHHVPPGLAGAASPSAVRRAAGHSSTDSQGASPALSLRCSTSAQLHSLSHSLQQHSLTAKCSRSLQLTSHDCCSADRRPARGAPDGVGGAVQRADGRCSAPERPHGAAGLCTQRRPRPSPPASHPGNARIMLRTHIGCISCTHILL